MPQDIEEFLMYLATERGLSDSYQLLVQRSLEAFSAWLEKHTPTREWRRVEPQQITDFLVFRKRSGLQASSVRIDAVAVRIFFRFLVTRRAWTENPAETLTLPRPEKHLPEALHVEQVRKLIESIGPNDPLGLRDRAMFELLYSSGLRVSELCDARLENINLDDGFIRVIGKGKKTRLIPIGQPACAAIRTYLQRTRCGGGAATRQGPKWTEQEKPPSQAGSSTHRGLPPLLHPPSLRRVGADAKAGPLQSRSGGSHGVVS